MRVPSLSMSCHSISPRRTDHGFMGHPTIRTPHLVRLTPGFMLRPGDPCPEIRTPRNLRQAVRIVRPASFQGRVVGNGDCRRGRIAMLIWRMVCHTNCISEWSHRPPAPSCVYRNVPWGLNRSSGRGGPDRYSSSCGGPLSEASGEIPGSIKQCLRRSWDGRAIPP